MDEPLSNLDAKLRNQMRAEIIKLREKIQTTFIYVTHDQTEAMTLGDRIVIMKDGFIQQIGTPQEVFNHPYNLFVATFIGTPQMNMFENAKLVKVDGKYAVQLDKLTVALCEEKQAALAKNNVAEQDVVLGVRPEHIELGSGIEGRVDVSEMMGSSVHLHVTSMGRDVVLVVSTMNMSGAEVAALSNGSTVKFTFPGHVCHVFSKETGINLEVEDLVGVGLEHLLGDLLPPVGGQAVLHHAVALGHRHQLIVDLIAHKGLFPLEPSPAPGPWTPTRR